jgi:hypothetical protein
LRRRIFELKREEVSEGWRTLHSEELHNLYVSQNVIMVIKSMRKGLTGHIAQMGKMRNACSILAVKPKGKRL